MKTFRKQLKKYLDEKYWCSINALHWMVTFLLFELFYMPLIGHMDWIGLGLGHRVDGLGWIGFRKLDPRPTLE